MRQVFNMNRRTAFDPSGIDDQTTVDDTGALMARLDHLEANCGDATLSISSQLDVQEWVVEQKIGLCGNFWDLFSILAQMEPKKETRTQKALANQNGQPKQHFGSGLDLFDVV